MKKIVFGLSVISLTTFLISSYALCAGGPEKGRTVYQAFCVTCHGFNGGGDGPEAAGLNPKPTNFTNQVAVANLTPQDIERAVITGKQDTAMKGFGSILTKDDIDNLFAYLNTIIAKQ